ncbi:transposase [Chryseobacterium sp. JJR-5R]|uniref:transposase n=1 Tax=Chryseobacterium sp. JJR-5R TaxID=3093923 RepID=UPI002A764CE9|nr:transposase [Chryseobacterium sp. JJR-5R]WPO83392.1 transposase [Chryseobacterium sp. JJR-5R]
MNFKYIHIGSTIKKRVGESRIELPRICTFMKCSEEEVLEMYSSEDLSAGTLLRWSKLLEYDFFRIYTQHLILYSPPSNADRQIPSVIKTKLPVFRKNIYSKEIIDFILDLIRTGSKTKTEIVQEYRIPKTTLYKWISKNITENTPEDENT